MDFQVMFLLNRAMSSPMSLDTVSFEIIDGFALAHCNFIDREGKWGMRIESAYVVRKFKVSLCFMKPSSRY